MSRASARWKHTEKVIDKMHAETVKEWCMALHGNHDEHQCHKEPGHTYEPLHVKADRHECYCGVWW